MRGRRLFIFISVLALVFSMVGSQGASGAQQQKRTRTAKERAFHREVIRPALRAAQHGPSTDHLPATRKNVQLVSKLRLTRTPGGISDVHYFRGHAYLGGWAPNCRFDTQGNAINGGGTYVVNVRNPRNPRRVAFIDAGNNNYVTEGIHAFRMNNQYFQGDVLIISNEACDSTQPHRGGIDIYDISDPSNPVALSLGVGDTDYQFPGMGPEANMAHSAMGWFNRADGDAYAVLVDNEEFDDIDILDITNPRRPGLIAETGLDEWPACDPDAIPPVVEPCVSNNGFGENAFHHDMWVEKFGGHWHLMASYWDAGWVDLNVDDPSNPIFLGDSDYATEDPEFAGASPPEGNAHQGEWSRNRALFFGSDEDFSASRFETFQITSGPFAGEERGAGEFGWTVPIANKFPDEQVNGPTVWGGSGCTEDVNGNGTSDREEAIADANAADVPDPGAGEEKVIVFTRGVCFFSIKVETGQLAGYDVVIIGNHHAGAGGGTSPDAFICGGQGHEYTKTAVGICTGHRTMHDFFGDTPEYGAEAYNGEDMADVPLGTVGEDILGSVIFDGFGYVHSFAADSSSGAIEELDTFAPAAVKNPANSFGFGTLSVHEVEADPRFGKRLVYVAWYAAGFRVLAYDSAGNLRQVGRFIARKGNDFWGVAVQKRGARRPLIHESDRDFGLFVFRYTGPE